MYMAQVNKKWSCPPLQFITHCKTCRFYLSFGKCRAQDSNIFNELVKILIDFTLSCLFPSPTTYCHSVTKQLLHAVIGSTPSGINGTLGFFSDAICPLWCTKHHGPHQSVQQLYIGSLYNCWRCDGVHGALPRCTNPMIPITACNSCFVTLW